MSVEAVQQPILLGCNNIIEGYVFYQFRRRCCRH